MFALRSFPVLLIALLLISGCVSNRLEGPIYGADGPAWIRSGFVPPSAPPVRDIDLDHRVLLIGDSGIFLEEDQTLVALSRWSRQAPSSTVIFLGDNVYNEGLVEGDRKRGERVLLQLLASSASHKVFIPGNHDWGFSPKGQNQQAILNQQAFIDAWSLDSAEFIPRDGCMGPTTRVLHQAGPGQRDVVFIAIDPTPWLNPRLREACPTPETKEGFLAALDRALADHAEDFVLVSSHYPLRTGGPHGGLTYGPIGNLITGILGWAWGGLMNTYEPAYAEWVERTQAVLRRHPPVAYAAGHDHNLQVLDAEDFARIEIVSGAGAKDRVTTVTSIEPTIFAHAVQGFVVLDFGMRDGEETVLLRVIETGAGKPVFEMDVP